MCELAENIEEKELNTAIAELYSPLLLELGIQPAPGFQHLLLVSGNTDGQLPVFELFNEEVFVVKVLTEYPLNVQVNMDEWPLRVGDCVLHLNQRRVGDHVQRLRDSIGHAQRHSEVITLLVRRAETRSAIDAVREVLNAIASRSIDPEMPQDAIAIGQRQSANGLRQRQKTIAIPNPNSTVSFQPMVTVHSIPMDAQDEVFLIHVERFPKRTDPPNNCDSENRYIGYGRTVWPSPTSSSSAM